MENCNGTIQQENTRIIIVHLKVNIKAFLFLQILFLFWGIKQIRIRIHSHKESGLLQDNYRGNIV